MMVNDEYWSGRPDLNGRPPEPHSGALHQPGVARRRLLSLEVDFVPNYRYLPLSLSSSVAFCCSVSAPVTPPVTPPS
jgi:hypothetical protein